jgi:4-amino-4-deoxy-L-arabinose transferase-like glycosyltransferase
VTIDAQPTAEIPERARHAALRARPRLGHIDAVLAAAVAVGLVLRAWGLGTQSLWYDEWLTTESTAGSVPQLFRSVSEVQGIPPPYFLLVWVWVRLVGDGEAALRASSLLAGAATVPVAYAIARELGQRRAVARAAALLVAVHPMLVWYSQEARPYALLSLGGALSLLAAARARNRGRARDFVVWGLVAAGGVALHYFAVFIVLAEAAWLLAARRGQWRELVLGCMPSLVVVAGLAPFGLRQHSHAPNRDWIADFALTDRVREAGQSALVGPSPPGGHLWAASALVAAFAVLSLVSRLDRRDRRAAAVLAGVGGSAAVAPLAAVAVGTDVFLSRYVIASLVPLLVAVAVGLVARAPSRVGGAAVAVYCGVSLAIVVAGNRDPELQRADWRAVAEVAGTGSDQRVLVVNFNGGQSGPLRRYFDDPDVLGDDETIHVDQIDVLTTNPASQPCNYFVGRACGFVFLGGPLPEPLAGEFGLAERVELDQFTIERYRSDRAVAVTKSLLIGLADPPSAVVWVS